MTPCAPHTGPPRTPRERTPCLLGVRAHPALSPRAPWTAAGDGGKPRVKNQNDINIDAITFTLAKEDIYIVHMKNYPFIRFYDPTYMYTPPPLPIKKKEVQIFITEYDKCIKRSESSMGWANLLTCMP